MEHVSVIAKNEDACKLLDCFVAYKRLVSKINVVESDKDRTFDIHAVEFANTKPELVA